MLALLGLSACATPGSKNTTAEAIRHEMDAITRERAKPAPSEAVSNALLPPLAMLMPKAESKPLEARFDLAVNNTPASQVFMAIVSGTRYNMLVPAGVSDNISLNLKDVTVFEALEAIRELYGYEYRIDANRIYIQPIALQTRLFQVSYLTATRSGSSTLMVQSSSNNQSNQQGGQQSSQQSSLQSNQQGSQQVYQQFSEGGAVSSNVTTRTNSKANFWEELDASLKAIVGSEQGRSVVINSMSGVIVVRAMPDEMKNVTAYLKASQISIERQVILEAKIVEVQLNDGFQSGVNWAAFKSSPNSRTSMGQLSPGASLTTNGGMTDGTLTSTPGSSLSFGGGAAGALFGLAFQTSNFAAMLNFLETQGNVHVLSSPRIATLNNQKAILKVGTDEYFITGVSSTPTTTTGNTTTPGTTTAIYSPIFSGIALDVTPSINENNEIILHVHPSVSKITEKNIALVTGGAAGGTIPMALTSVSETDSVVRARDGQIVVIGGLMRQATFDDQSGLPGLPKAVFGKTNKITEKRELIILLKPTVVDSDKDWSDDIAHSREHMNSLANASGARP